MARIIQAQDLGPRPSLRSNRQVVRDRSGDDELGNLEDVQSEDEFLAKQRGCRWEFQA